MGQAGGHCGWWLRRRSRGGWSLRRDPRENWLQGSGSHRPPRGTASMRRCGCHFSLWHSPRVVSSTRQRRTWGRGLSFAFARVPSITHPRAWFGNGIKIEISKYSFLVFLRISVSVKSVYFLGVQDGYTCLRSQEAREPPASPGGPAAANGWERK